MTWDFRQHLQSDLKTEPEIVEEVTRVHAGTRPAGTPVPALVWRCTKFVRGEDVAGDDGTRDANFDLVIWAKDLEACLAIRGVLSARYHAKGGYEFGGSDDPGIDPPIEPIEVDSSRVFNEYDGDRVTDSYSEEGAVALTLEVNFMWRE